MSATIGDPGDLSRRLGVRPIVKIPVRAEYAEKTSGRRLVVMNRIEDVDIPERLAVVILTVLREHPKSVWLCSSEAEARHYQAVVSEWLNLNGLVGHPTWFLSPLGDEIDQFKASPNGHLFVAGRFDGMDFKADECRLVVITTVPRAINLQEEFIATYLRDSGFMLRRLNQRIVQALGRCNRSDEDFGIYVLADRRFATHFGRDSNREGLPRNIMAEIDMAQDSAEIEVATLADGVQKFLRRDFREYDAEIARYLAGVPEPVSTRPSVDTAEDEVMGWVSLFASQNYEIAADRFERCWDVALGANQLEIGALYGWQWAKALYLQSLLNEPLLRDRALGVLESAIRRGGQSAWFNRMRASLSRARHLAVIDQEIARDDFASNLLRVFDDLLERYGARGTRFDRWCESITSLLESTSHAQFQEGLEKLGQVMGFHAARPRYDSATDCRWRGVFGNSREVITFEAKVEQDAGHELAAHDIGQAHNQFARAMAEFQSHGYTVRGTIVTHLTSITGDAEASLGPIRIVSKAAVVELWKRLKLALSLYRDAWSLYDIPARNAAALAARTRLPPTGWIIRAIDTDLKFISLERLLSEWP
jgi:hypothetical protein